MKEINYDKAVEDFSYLYDATDEETKYKICTWPMQFNCLNAVECYREMSVSYLNMIPLIKMSCDSLEEADYILYSHPFARIEDMSPAVIRDLQHLATKRKENAEIIVVGKACNVEPLLNGSISNITFYQSHYAEKLGKRFGLDIKEEYFVYDTDRSVTINETHTDYGVLSIWPVDGCLRKCKFCRRTYMNIPFESLSLERIKEELDYLKEYNPKVLKYVDLRAENLTEYGIDIYGKSRLADLIDLIDSYDEVKMIFISIGLAICEITDEILDALCRTKKLYLCNMNLEAGSNKMLSFIGKDHTRERAIHIFKEIRKAHPDVYIESTLMIGFPTETLTDIYELADLILETSPDFILCNFVEIAPKSPLTQYEQLPESLKEYHLSLLLRLLKRQKRSRALEIRYEKIYKPGKRKTERFKAKVAKNLEDFSFLLIDRKELLLKPNTRI